MNSTELILNFARMIAIVDAAKGDTEQKTYILELLANQLETELVSLIMTKESE